MALVVAAVTAGCGASTKAASETPARCPVTLPNHDIPPGQGHNPGHNRAPYLGNGRLWTVIGKRGVIVARPADIEKDGSIAMKFPWWRKVRGRLKITGRRLDTPGVRLRASILRGYGRTGFQATGIFFPSAGCWRVTGRAGSARLSFVTLLRKPHSGHARVRGKAASAER
ncbi:MAG: hypothetical protein QOG63_110 [Thermoleophilaceae bacterium]|nr:hypothetical protein [Thermoleophilaceae bacterium]